MKHVRFLIGLAVCVLLAMGGNIWLCHGPVGGLRTIPVAHAAPLMPGNVAGYFLPYEMSVTLSTAALSANVIYPGDINGEYHTFFWDITADGSGDATVTAPYPTPGVLFSAFTQASTPAASASWDIFVHEAVPTVNPLNGTVTEYVVLDDLADAELDNRSATVTEKVEFDLATDPEQVTGRIHIIADNMGAGGKAVLYLVIKRNN